jgi:hypothetical protein
MKKTFNYFLLFVFIPLFFMSCNNTSITIGKGAGKKIMGNGKIISETRDVKPFNYITIAGVFNIILQQGTKESVKVETDENIQSLVLVSVYNDTLKVKMKDSTSIGKMNKLDVNITLVDIKKLSTMGVGQLKCSGTLHLKELDLNCQGVGATMLNLEAEKLNVKSGIVGILTLSGIVNETSIDHNGVGVIKAFDLRTDRLTLHTSGVGNAEVFAANEISIDASGIGSVEYKGGAAKQHIKADNIGKVICVDCK